jgi:putative Mg2+ transporter-C (MgtC) family protein
MYVPAALQNLRPESLLDSLISLATAFVLGAAIGAERQYRQRTAGLRTNVLVAVASASFVDLGMRLAPGSVQIIAYVVSGVGFLGAGAIMKEGVSIRGLNTAATLWGSAAVGACAGADMIAEALLTAGFVLAANTLLRPMANRILRSPVNEETTEANYSLSVICSQESQRDVLDAMQDELERARYPIGDLDVHPFGDTQIEIEAQLAPTSVDAAELDALQEKIGRLPGVVQVYWGSRSSDA